MTEVRPVLYPSSDGIHTIHAREWVPDASPRGIVHILHGVADHMDYYDHVARFLCAHGFLVCGGDHLGHGKTAGEGPYGLFAAHDGWTLATADVRRLRQIMTEQHPGLPYILLGHSMGSFLARTYVCRYPGEADALILSGTGREPAFLVALCKLLTGSLCHLRGPDYVSKAIFALSMGPYNKPFAPNRTPLDWLTRDEAAVDRAAADPGRTFLPTVSLFRDMMDGLQYISDPKKLAQMDKDTPVYFLSGGKDPVGAMGKGVEAVAGMFRRAGCRDVTVKLYPDGRHEMFNELNRQEVLADLLNWLNAKL